MKPASIKEIKDELKHQEPQDLFEIVLRLVRFKKENKELLTFLLFSASDETGFIMAVKNDIDRQFEEINRSSYYFMKKSMRKILRELKKYSRYSGKKETEIELLIYFLKKMHEFSPSIHRNKTLENLYSRQLKLVEKNLLNLHEDLQFDFQLDLENLKN